MAIRWGHAGLLVVAGLVGCTAQGGAEAPAEKEKAPAKGEAHVTVTVEPARLGPVTESAEGLGRCEALPDHLATLTPAVAGHVHTLVARQGDKVKKNQPIVELDTVVAKADLAEKTAIRDGLKASLALLKSLPRLDERRANELAVDQAKLALERAQKVAEGMRPLLARHEVSEMQMFEADHAVDLAKIQLQTAIAQLKVMLIGPRPEAVAEAEGKIKTADATVAFSQAHLDFHTIRSPIDGVLDSLICHPGEELSIGGAIGDIVDTSQVFASIWLPPRSALLVRVGQPAQVWPEETQERSSEASAAAEQVMAGKVVFIGQIADAQTGNLPIRVLVDNPDGRLTLGQTIKVSITLRQRSAVLQVPVAAIFDLGEGPVLNVVRDGKSATLHPQVGDPHEGWVPVSGTDLKEGEPVIVEGGYNLPEETPVKTAPAKTAGKPEQKAGKTDEKAGKAEQAGKAEETS